MAVGFGKDTSCTDSLETGRLVSGKELVCQALYRRLITPRGTLGSFTDEHLTYGLDVASFIGMVGYEAAVRSLPAQIQNELLKDDRVASVTCTAQMLQSGIERELAISINVVLEDEAGDFDFTLSVTAARALLTGVSL